MLHLYLAPDNILLDQLIQSSGYGFEHILPLVHLGGLRLEEHRTLTESVPEVNSIPYFDDSHRKSFQVKELYEICNAFIASRTLPKEKFDAFMKLQTMLESAILHNEGIIALCD